MSMATVKAKKNPAEPTRDLATGVKPAKKVAKKAAKKTAKTAAKKTTGKILLPIRMSHEADMLLRTSEKAYRIGNLTKRVEAAIAGVDLDAVSVEERPRTPHLGKDYAITTVQLPKDVKERLSAVAENRGTSMAALIDGAIRQFYKEKKRT
jgi:hypothetical protein